MWVRVHNRCSFAQGSRVPVPEGSDPSSSWHAYIRMASGLNGEYNALLRHSKNNLEQAYACHIRKHMCVKMDIICMPLNYMVLKCSQISIFTRIGISITIIHITLEALQCHQGFSTMDSSWSVLQHRLQRQLPGSQLVLPWLSSAFCVRAPDLQFHLNEEKRYCFLIRRLWWAGGPAKGR